MTWTFMRPVVPTLLAIAAFASLDLTAQQRSAPRSRTPTQHASPRATPTARRSAPRAPTRAQRSAQQPVPRSVPRTRTVERSAARTTPQVNQSRARVQPSPRNPLPARPAGGSALAQYHAPSQDDRCRRRGSAFRCRAAAIRPVCSARIGAAFSPRRRTLGDRHRRRHRARQFAATKSVTASHRPAVPRAHPERMPRLDYGSALSAANCAQRPNACGNG